MSFKYKPLFESLIGEMSYYVPNGVGKFKAWRK